MHTGYHSTEEIAADHHGYAAAVATHEVVGYHLPFADDDHVARIHGVFHGVYRVLHLSTQTQSHEYAVHFARVRGQRQFCHLVKQQQVVVHVAAFPIEFLRVGDVDDVRSLVHVCESLDAKIALFPSLTK